MKVLDLQTASTRVIEDENTEISWFRGVSIACFIGLDRDGKFLITNEDGAEKINALSTIALTESDIGTKVAVACINNDIGNPIIIGRIQRSIPPNKQFTAKIDGERLILHAANEIELRCGEASIVLTRAGKILIKGNYVLTRSSGANKIKGAYVDIN